MKTLILGATGQVGREISRSFAPLGSVICADRTAFDLNFPESLRPVLRAVAPDVIVNAAAYTNVDAAESDPDAAARVNAESVAVLAQEAKRSDAWLIHYSTDYVYGGSWDQPWRESDPAAPVNVYGRTKLAGDQAVTASGCRYITFRTSWVYASEGRNFVRTILRLAAERDSLKVVADQFGVPTSAAWIADTTAVVLAQAMRSDSREMADSCCGIYHLVPSGVTTWHGVAIAVLEFAREAGASLRTQADDVSPIQTSQYPLPAVRPQNSRLNTQKLRRNFQMECPDWKQHLRQTVRTIIEGRQ